MLKKLNITAYAFLLSTAVGCGLANRIDPFAQSTSKQADASVYYSRTEAIMSTSQLSSRLNKLFGPASGVVHAHFSGPRVGDVTVYGAVASLNDHNDYHYPIDYSFFDANGNINMPVMSTFFSSAATVLTANDSTISPLHYIGLKEFESYLCNSGGAIPEKNYHTFNSSNFTSSIDNSSAFFDPANTGDLLPDDFDDITDEAVKFSLIAAANAWQSDFDQNSPEVKVLIDLYRSTYLSPDAGNNSLSATQTAKKAICLAALDAPQFWFGNPDVLEPFNLIAGRVALRDLTDDEKARARSGSMTPRQFLKQIQDDPNETGFRSNMRKFLTDWLAFAGYVDGRLGTVYGGGNASGIPALAGQIDNATFDGFQASGSSTVTPMTTPHPYGVLNWDASFASAWDNPQGCIPPVVADSTYATSWRRAAYPAGTEVLKEQEFNADTSLLIWDAWNPDTAHFETMGGWVRDTPGARAAYETDMQTTYGWTGFSTSTPGQCVDFATDQTHAGWFNLAVSGQPNQAMRYLGLNGWIRCHGRMKDVQNNQWVQIDLSKTNQTINTTWSNGTPNVLDGPNTVNSANPIPAHVLSFLNADNWSYVFGISASFGNVPPYDLRITHGKLRVRRFAHNTSTNQYDDQNGYSVVKGMFSNQPIYVCNSYQRFLATCQYRNDGTNPSWPVNYHTSGNGSNNTNAALTTTWNPAIVSGPPNMSYQTRNPTHAWAHPALLQQMRCGMPVQSALTETSTDGHSTFDGSVAFPTTAPYQDVAFNFESRHSNENVNLVNSFSLCEGNHPECQAQVGLSSEVAEEPYRLFWDTVDNHRDFRKFLTADYTFIKPSLATWYQGGAFALNMRAPASLVNPPTASNWNTPLKYTQADMAVDPVHGDVNWKFFDGNVTPETVTGAWSYQPKTLSGIMTMPGFFYGMSSAGARGAAARIFSRLLGIQASDVTGVYDISTNVVNPNHAAAYNALLNTAGGADFSNHLKSNACMTCHYSLDPLGSAMFSATGYGQLVGSGGTLSSFAGEIGGSNMAQFGGQKGVGAFLNQTVTGLREVAQAAANSRYFARNVVMKNFRMLYQRDPDFDEQTGYIEPCVDFFMDSSRGNYDYYLLMQYMVSNTAFNTGN